MESTYRALVSRVRSGFKMISSDNLITDRVILAELQATNIKLVVQQLQKRAAWNSPNIFTPLSCIQMEEVPLYECCNVTSNCNIAKSTITLPKIVDVNNSLVIQGVFSLNKKNRFKELGNPERYANYLKIYPDGKDKFFWIQDGYLYITDPDIETVSLSAFFVDVLDPSEYSCNDNSECPLNPLDLPIKTLPKLEDDIVNITRQKLMETYKRSSPDNTENNLDESQ